MLRRLAISLVIAIASIHPVFLRGSDELNQQLKRIFASETFAAKVFGPARWIEGGAAFTTVESSTIVRYETATGKRSVLVSAVQLTPKDGKPLKIDDYRWSEDSKRLLVFTESKKVWRLNTRGDYWVLDRSNGWLKKIGGDAPASSLMYAKFAPDASRVAYVRANNLYVEDVATGAIRALTSDGSDTLVNGASDWVYEEELNVRDGFRWSPDGRSIAFWQFDSSGVQPFALINNTDSLYPKITNIPYPKAGTKNSSVRVGVLSADGGAPRWMQIPGDPREHYIFRLDWAENSGELAIGQLNRKQNTAVVFMADAQSGSAKEIFRDQDETWVDVQESHDRRNIDRFDWLNGGKAFLWLSERDGWRHAYSVSRQGREPVLLTPGPETSSAFRLSTPTAAGYTSSPRTRTAPSAISTDRPRIDPARRSA
jgi:dipeptidyl-peptidase-4